MLSALRSCWQGAEGWPPPERPARGVLPVSPPLLHPSPLIRKAKLLARLVDIALHSEAG